MHLGVLLLIKGVKYLLSFSECPLRAVVTICALLYD